MLKRQRQPSPPPSSPSTPFVADSAGDLIERNSKRRRTAAPVLDGTARGWATQQERLDDDEYIYSDDEVQDVAQNPDPYHVPSQSQYKSTNTMLRELHTMHQRRLLFSSSSEGKTPNMLPSPYPPQSTHSSHYHTGTDKIYLPPPNESMRSVHTPQPIEKGIQSDGMLMEEATRVAEIYEGPNKYLGLLFLSRRRKLGSSNEIPGK